MRDFYNTYEVAIRAAIAGSKAIMEIYEKDFDSERKEDGSPVTKADLASSNIINEYLEATGIPVTGEEIEKKPYFERKEWDRLWCVDPLDGTKEFIKRNGEFVVNIALIEHQKPIFGLIASPTKKQLIIGGKDVGAFQLNYEDAFFPENWRKLPDLNSVIDTPVHVISSRSHYSGNLLSLAETLTEEYGPIESAAMGSALKFFELVNGRADVYPRFAPTMEWDIAAGQAIFEAIGGKIVSIETGEPLVYNKRDLTNPYFIGYNSSMKLSLEFYQH